jgi:hypothetical protein
MARGTAAFILRLIPSTNSRRCLPSNRLNELVRRRDLRSQTIDTTTRGASEMNEVRIDAVLRLRDFGLERLDEDKAIVGFADRARWTR